MLEWLIRAILDTDMVYIAKNADNELYATSGVRIRMVNGQLSIGGQLASVETPDLDGATLELWTTDDEMIEISGLDIDSIDGDGPVYFSASSVPGMTRASCLNNSGNVIKQVSFAI